MTSMRGSANKLSQSTFGRRIPVTMGIQFLKMTSRSLETRTDSKERKGIGAGVTGRRKPNVRVQLEFVPDTTLVC